MTVFVKNKKAGPSAAIETITPEQATDILDKLNEGNRALDNKRILRMASDMREGKWLVNGESIKFDEAGRLVDGQHRLWACVEAEKPFDTFVVREVPREAFLTIDTGKPKSVSVFLGNCGCKYASSVGATIRWLIAMELGRGESKNVNVTEAAIVEYWREHPEVSEAVEAVAPIRKLGLSVGLCAALYIKFAERDALAAIMFFRDLESGTNLSQDDPVHVLREKIIRMKANKRLHQRMGAGADMLAMIINTWNARRSGKTLHAVKGAHRDKNRRPILPGIRRKGTEADQPVIPALQ